MIYFPYLYKLVTGGTFLLGLFFAFRGVFLLKEYGAMRTMMSSQTSIIPPLVNIFVGLALLYWKVMLDAFLITIFGSTSLDQKPLGTTEIEEELALIIRLFGFIAFVRGWILLSRAASHGAQPGTLTKSLMYMFSGIFLINIYGTWTILQSLLPF